MNVPSPFSADDPTFDDYDAFVPESVPEPGAYLTEHDVLAGREHVAFHRLTRELFDERGVYDMTFGYNLARLNLDVRHPDAGYRYARERGTVDGPDAGDRDVLIAEFTPTTEFCPQSTTLAKGSFRAWNGLADRHEYDLVRVRVDGMHHKSGVINEELRDHEARYLDSGDLPDERGGAGGGQTGVPNEEGYAEETGTPF
ncbi:hypothetical protein BV210_15355 [Halorientalis sp. IM1011]|uniref:hypothetical protein n=1 Tax=Halorientalis sp. IM1011 TaxID=1932360 RepID=UPI00097CC496|nr:hypothetical protein [Halorientalis sp. IM1011]AQL43993.1 hypothetical protein BV210_15355 [Halorientalis sp. IM1011]